MIQKITDKELLATLNRLDKFATLTDSKFRIPFTQIQFGIDAIIGLVPVIGDMISLVLSGYLLSESFKLGLPRSVKTKMIRNMLLDWLIGLVPVFGDFVDVFFRANNRNMKLLVEQIDSEYQKRNKPANLNAPVKKKFIQKLIDSKYRDLMILLVISLVCLVIFLLFEPHAA